MGQFTQAKPFIIDPVSHWLGEACNPFNAMNEKDEKMHVNKERLLNIKEDVERSLDLITISISEIRESVSKIPYSSATRLQEAILILMNARAKFLSL